MNFYWQIVFLAVAGVDTQQILSWYDNFLMATPPSSLPGTNQSSYSSYGSQGRGMYGYGSTPTSLLPTLSRFYGQPIESEPIIPATSSYEQRSGLPANADSSFLSSPPPLVSDTSIPYSNSSSSFIDSLPSLSTASSSTSLSNLSVLSSSSTFSSVSTLTPASSTIAPSLTPLPTSLSSPLSTPSTTPNIINTSDVSSTVASLSVSSATLLLPDSSSQNVTSQSATESSLPLPYPTYTSVPEGLNFSCQNRLNGYYADQETDCQVWHWCLPGGQHFSFICPVQTLFNQAFLVCDWWYNVNCSAAEEFYTVNENLYKLPMENDEEV